MPALLRRGWWRGMTGFEPQANRLRPGGPDVRELDHGRSLRGPAADPPARLRRARGATLALGAGGTAAVSSVARTILLDPLPIAKRGAGWRALVQRLVARAGVPPPAPGFSGFQRIAAYRPEDVTLESPGQPLRLIPGIAVSAELFDVLGRPAMLGTDVRCGEDLIGAELVAVLSHSLWQELGSDPNIVGKPLRLGGVSRTVVGVMPRGFWFPSPATRVWTAAQMNPENRSGRYTLVGRVPRARRSRAWTVRCGRWRACSPPTSSTRIRSGTRRAIHRSSGARVLRRRRQASADRDVAAMAVILLIACANVAALMLGQVDARANEIGVRAALGATRQRLIQQLLAESLLLGAVAGAVGAVLAVAGFQVLLQALPLGALADTAAPRLAGVLGVDGGGARRGRARRRRARRGAVARRQSPGRARHDAHRRRRHAWRALESALVVGQVALAVLLAAGAGLLIRSVANLRAIDPGVDVDGVVVVDTTMPARLSTAERRVAVDAVLPALRALPGVQSVGAAQKLPLRGSGDNWGLAVRGRGDLNATTAIRFVTHDYFTVMGMRVGGAAVSRRRIAPAASGSSSSTRRWRRSSSPARIRSARSCRPSTTPASASSASCRMRPRRRWSMGRFLRATCSISRCRSSIRRCRSWCGPQIARTLPPWSRPRGRQSSARAGSWRSRR